MNHTSKPASKAPASKAPASKAPASKAPASKAPANPLEAMAPASMAPASMAPANPLEAMAASLTSPPAPVVTPHAAMLAKAASVNNIVTVGGVAVVAANNVAARHASLNKPLAVVAASASYTIGKTPKLTAAYCQQNWPGIVATCKPGATGAQIQAAGTTSDFIRYAVRNGWLITA